MINYRKIWEKTQLPYDLFYDIVVFPSTLFISIFCLNTVKIILCSFHLLYHKHFLILLLMFMATIFYSCIIFHQVNVQYLT